MLLENDVWVTSAGEKKTGTYNHVDEKFIRSVVSMLSAERASDYQTWTKALWAIKNAELEYKCDLRELAHEFSQKTTHGNYDDDCCNALYDKAKEKLSAEDKLLGMASLRLWAKEDSPVEYKKLCAISFEAARVEEVVPVGHYEDVDGLIAKPGVTIVEIENWMRSCIFKVRGATSYWNVRRKGGEYERADIMFTGAEGYSAFIVNDVEGKKVTTKKLYRDILAELMQKPCFKPNLFDAVEFLPMIGVPEHKDRKFNLFTGFKVMPTASSLCDPDVALILKHLREVIANDNDAYYEYMMCWFAHLFQKPTKKVGSMLVWSGPQGCGKNIIVDWIGNMIYGSMYMQLASLESLTQKFNAFQGNKMFAVLNEIQSYGGSFKDADKLKSLITEQDRKIEPKGKEAYMVKCYGNYIMLTNNDWTVRVESDDRRYACSTASGKYVKDSKYFDALGAVLTPETASKSWVTC